MSPAEFGGACHCGCLRFRYRTALTPEAWSVRACQCSFCLKHDALSTSDPSGVVEFLCADNSLLQRYRFGLKTADFLLCRQCGVYVGAVLEAATGRFGIINTHALQPMPANIADVGAISYDSEDEQGRIRRREERWTPVNAVP